MNAIQTLIAIEEIKWLKAEYFDFVDSRRWDDWGNLFAEDCVAYFDEGRETQPIEGRAALVAIVSEFNKDAITIHRGDNPRIEIISQTEANGVWAMQDRLHWPDSACSPMGVCNFEGWGRYFETYVKSDADWKIATMRLTRQFTRTY